MTRLELGVFMVPKTPIAARGRLELCLPTISRIFLHPIKSLDPQEVTAVEVLPTGALAHDRTFALVDSKGAFVNAKRHTQIFRLRSHFDVASGCLCLRDESNLGLGRRLFDIRSERDALSGWLSAFFGFAVFLVEDRRMGFPDDPQSPGPTVISTATLEEIGRWFDLPIEQVRARFRSNIEINDVPPFWEDRLIGAPGVETNFAIGSIRFNGINPCQRCTVPARDPWTGVLNPTFPKRFSELRSQTLPEWVARDRFDNFYRVAVNTRICGWRYRSVINVGDAVQLKPPSIFARLKMLKKSGNMRCF